MMASLSAARSKTLLFAAFGLLLAALTALAALGLARIESFNRQLNDLTGAQARKIGAVSDLFLANGQRTSLIDRLFAAETPPARRSVLAQYQHAISVYSAAVKKLDDLPVAGAERDARDAAIAAAAAAQGIGDQTVTLLMRGEIAPASEINLKQAVSADSRLQETLYLLL